MPALGFVTLLLGQVLTPAPTPAAQDPQQPQRPPSRSGRATRADEAPARRDAEPPAQTAVSALGDVPLTGNWLDLRAALWRHGVRLTLSSLSDASLLAAGGLDPGASAVRTLFDAELDIDGERLLGWNGARLYCDLQLQRGADGSLDTGDYQVYSNIDGPDRSQLAQVFVEQALLDGVLRCKIGKFDTNSDFAYVDNGLRFVHSSFGFAPTVLGFPTYPDPAFGAALFADLPDGCYLRCAVQDGATQAGQATGSRGPRTLFEGPGGLFSVLEAGAHWRDGLPTEGRFAVGAWHHSGRFDRLSGGSERGTEGWYATFDQRIWHDDRNPASKLGVFLQYGHAEPQLSPAQHYVGAGLCWTGPLSTRPDDACGIGCAAAIWRRHDDALAGDAEVALECFYSLAVTPWLRIKPDVQYIHDPGGRREVADALVLTLRLALEF